MKLENYATPEMEMIEVFAKDIIRTSLEHGEQAGSTDEQFGASGIPGLQ